MGRETRNLGGETRNLGCPAKESGVPSQGIGGAKPRNGGGGGCPAKELEMTSQEIVLWGHRTCCVWATRRYFEAKETGTGGYH